MITLRCRISGTPGARDRIIDRLEGIDHVDRIEEVADLMPNMDDDDSSSAGLAENSVSDVYALEIRVDNADGADLVRRLADVEARETGAALEFLERF